MENLISVIVPIYKVEPYLDTCIRSLLTQTYKNLEIILVDDGSPDRCGEIADEYATLDSRVTVIHKPNGGPADARNVGIEAAHGDYIMFLDSDDYYDATMCETLLNKLLLENADVVSANYYTFDGVSEPIQHHCAIQESERVFGPYELLKYYLEATGPYELNIVWNKLYKASLFQGDAGLRFPIGKLQEDNFFVIPLYDKAKKVVFLDAPLYYYLQRSDSIMANFSDRFVTDTIDSYVATYEYIMTNKLPVVEELQLFLLNSYTDLYKRMKAKQVTTLQREELARYKRFVLEHTRQVSENSLWGMKQHLKRFLITWIW